MATHTPGPWQARADRRSSFVEDGRTLVFWEVVRPDPRDKGPYDPNRDMICDLAMHPDGEANARLIAAAPEMLAALRMVLDDPGLTAAANDVIRAAIRKAAG